MVLTLYVCGMFDLKMLLNRSIVLFLKWFKAWPVAYYIVFTL